MRAWLVLACLAAPARADRDPFAFPTAARFYEVVEGPSIAALQPATGAPRARCTMRAAPPVASMKRLRFECRRSGPPGSRYDALVAQTRHFVLDGGIRELPGAVDDPAQLADRGTARAFTFPRTLPKAGWTHEATSPGGARTQIVVRTETLSIAGKRGPAWVSDARWWAAGATTPERGAAAFVPGDVPALLCTITGDDAKPLYACLREDEPTPEELAFQLTDVPDGPLEGSMDPRKPSPRVALAKSVAHDKSSLKASTVAAKVNLAGIKRCYATLVKAKPAAKGTLKLAFTVNAVGKVEGATTDAFDAALTACVGPLVSSARFPIPMSEYGEPRTARFTLEYRLAMN